MMWGGIAMLVLAAPLTALMLVLGIRYSRKSNAVKRWATTTGTVLSSHAQAYGDSEGGTSYRPKVIYRYEVAGQSYQSERFDVYDLMGGYSGGSKRAAQKKADRYPAGGPVEVRYDPAQPDKSVLETTRPVFMIWFLFAMAAFILCMFVGGGAAMLWSAPFMP
jgi:hypothetical protein